MHLFEAALAWVEFDDDPRWVALADSLLQLCLEKLIDPSTGLLAEKFVDGWAIAREGGRFVFEPGHQYEWCWLMQRYETLTGKNAGPRVRQLFEISETCGISPDRRAAYDEVWSDLTPKLTSSRFWPQGERVKAAARLGEKPAAAEALAALMRYFDARANAASPASLAFGFSQ